MNDLFGSIFGLFTALKFYVRRREIIFPDRNGDGSGEHCSMCGVLLRNKPSGFEFLERLGHVFADKFRDKFLNVRVACARNL